jgi:hypothetical protein
MKQLGIHISYDEWRNLSKKGERCGIVGCFQRPSNKCLTCKTWYCYQHSRIHNHISTEQQPEKSQTNEG